MLAIIHTWWPWLGKTGKPGKWQGKKIRGIRQGKMKCERICHLKKNYLEKSVLY